jgi:hypothetical protein
VDDDAAPQTTVLDTINGEVVSMQRSVNELGFSCLAIDERDWLKIIDGVLEQLEMKQHGEDRLS